MHFRTHVKEELPRHLRPGRVLRRHGRARHAHRPVPRAARRARHRRQHHRLLLHRQRPPLQHLARRGARPPSAARRTPTGKAAGACPPWSAGPARSSPDSGPTRSSTTWTGCRPSSPPPATPTSRRSSCWTASRPIGRKLQGPPRRLQHPAAAHRRDREEPAQGDLLLLRRRRPDRPALRRLEADLHGAEGRGHASGSGWSPSCRCACR